MWDVLWSSSSNPSDSRHYCNLSNLIHLYVHIIIICFHVGCGEHSKWFLWGLIQQSNNSPLYCLVVTITHYICHFLNQADCMAHLLSMHLHQVVGGCDDNILWRKFTHINRELENVSKDLDLPRRIWMAWEKSFTARKSWNLLHKMKNSICLSIFVFLTCKFVFFTGLLR